MRHYQIVETDSAKTAFQVGRLQANLGGPLVLGRICRKSASDTVLEMAAVETCISTKRPRGYGTKTPSTKIGGLPQSPFDSYKDSWRSIVRRRWQGVLRRFRLFLCKRYAMDSSDSLTGPRSKTVISAVTTRPATARRLSVRSPAVVGHPARPPAISTPATPRRRKADGSRTAPVLAVRIGAGTPASRCLPT
jgi:hypothetical protein